MINYYNQETTLSESLMIIVGTIYYTFNIFYLDVVNILIDRKNYTIIVFHITRYDGIFLLHLYILFNYLNQNDYKTFKSNINENIIQILQGSVPLFSSQIC